MDSSFSGRELNQRLVEAVQALPGNDELLHLSEPFYLGNNTDAFAQAVAGRSMEEQLRIADRVFAGFPPGDRNHISKALEFYHGRGGAAAFIKGLAEVIADGYSGSAEALGRFARLALSKSVRDAIEAHEGLPTARAAAAMAVTAAFTDVYYVVDGCDGETVGFYRAVRGRPQNVRRRSRALRHKPVLEFAETAYGNLPSSDQLFERLVRDTKARKRASAVRALQDATVADAMKRYGPDEYDNVHSSLYGAIYRSAFSESPEHARKLVAVLPQEGIEAIAAAYDSSVARTFLSAVAQAAERTRNSESVRNVAQALLQDEVRSCAGRYSQVGSAWFHPPYLIADTAVHTGSAEAVKRVAETSDIYAAMGRTLFGRDIIKACKTGNPEAVIATCDRYMQRLEPNPFQRTGRYVARALRSVLGKAA